MLRRSSVLTLILHTDFLDGQQSPVHKGKYPMVAMPKTFLAITAYHLSYLTKVTEIWILKYSVQAISDLLLNNLSSC